MSCRVRTYFVFRLLCCSFLFAICGLVTYGTHFASCFGHTPGTQSCLGSSVDVLFAGCVCGLSADLAKQWCRISWGMFEVGKNDFCL